MAKKSEENTTAESTVEENSSGKGHATPSRKEREAANKRPLVPSDRKEAARMERARANEERNKARIGLAAGDERYLPMRDRGPQKKFARDFVDARYVAMRPGFAVHARYQIGGRRPALQV